MTPRPETSWGKGGAFRWSADGPRPQRVAGNGCVEGLTGACQAKAPRAGTARGPERTSPAATGRAPTADIIKMMGVARTCPEPCTAPSLAVATGFAQKALGSHLFRWAQRGWIVKVGRGEYKRTGTFPTEAPNE